MGWLYALPARPVWLELSIIVGVRVEPALANLFDVSLNVGLAAVEVGEPIFDRELTGVDGF